MASEVKWIKLCTDIFDNRKIKQIEMLEDGDSILVIWIKLLALAGNVNDNGFVYFTKDIPYTNDMLSTEFKRPSKLIEKALHTFEDFEMIEIIDDIMKISNWEKYQNIDGLEKIREQTRLRVQRHRLKQKELSNVTSNEDVTQGNAIDIEEELEVDIEKEKDIKHKYGEYKNVLLTDSQYEKLINEFPKDFNERIEKLSSYMKSTGKHYKDHLATIRNWSRMDAERNKNKRSGQMNNGFQKMLREEENIIDVVLGV